MLAGVVFDFDGVLVDTEPLHFEALREVLRSQGLDCAWEEYLSRYIGCDDRDAFREAYRAAGKTLSEQELARQVAHKADVFERLLREAAWRPYPGAVELVRELAGQVPLALCSGALRRDVAPILERVGLAGAFDVVVTADDVARSKPDPESYRKAHAGLVAAYPGRALPPERVVAIEDTPFGIEAARRAGLLVLAVTHTHPAAALHGAWRVVDSLAAVTRAHLEQWLRESLETGA